MTARHWTAIALAAWALAAFVALTSCCPRVPAPVVAPPCALGPAPVRVHFLTTRPGCPAPLVCYGPADEAALLGELQARRDYDERVAAFGAPTATAARPSAAETRDSAKKTTVHGVGLQDGKKPPPDERARVAPAP